MNAYMTPLSRVLKTINVGREIRMAAKANLLIVAALNDVLGYSCRAESR